jgi:hypothetical protein
VKLPLVPLSVHVPVKGLDPPGFENVNEPACADAVQLPVAPPQSDDHWNDPVAQRLARIGTRSGAPDVQFPTAAAGCELAGATRRVAAINAAPRRGRILPMLDTARGTFLCRG